MICCFQGDRFPLLVDELEGGQRMNSSCFSSGGEHDSNVDPSKEDTSNNLTFTCHLPAVFQGHIGLSSHPFKGLQDAQEPTLIQAHCWPYACAGRHVIGISKTGSLF